MPLYLFVHPLSSSSVCWQKIILYMLSHISIRRYTMSGCFIFDPSSHWRWFKTAFEVEKLWFLLCHSVFILELEFISMKQKLSQVNHLAILRYFFKLEAWKLLSQFSSVQSLSRVQLFVTSWTATRQASLSITNSWSLPKLMSIESVMPSNHLILCHPLLLPSIFPSIRVFSNESALRIKWPKYWSFSFNISPSNEHQRLISFRMDWLDLLAVQGTLKNLLQHHSSKASILRRSAFFTVQLSHPYIATGKTIALTRWTFVGKVMSLLFNMLSSLVITFLPRSKHLLISWLQSPSAVILEPKKIVSHCFHSFPIYFPWSDGTEWHDLSFLNVEL